MAQAVHHHAVRVAHGDEAELLGDNEDGEGEPGEEVDEGDDEEEHVGPLLPAHPPPLGLGVGAGRSRVQTQGIFYPGVDPGIFNVICMNGVWRIVCHMSHMVMVWNKFECKNISSIVRNL